MVFRYRELGNVHVARQGLLRLRLRSREREARADSGGQRDMESGKTARHTRSETEEETPHAGGASSRGDGGKEKGDTVMRRPFVYLISFSSFSF